jgi:cell wall-associated NlpC family hydrolase
MNLRRLIALIGIVLLASCAERTNPDVFTEILDSVKSVYAPDKRVALVDFSLEGNVVKGETNIPEAKELLVKLLNERGFQYTDSMKVLPEESLGEKIYAVAKNSVSNIRTDARHGAELSTQATLGTPLKVWKRKSGWYYIQMPDQYLGWVDAGGIQLMDSARFAEWKQNAKIIYTALQGFAYRQEDPNTTVSDLVFGNILEVEGSNGNYYQVKFPDGRKALVKKSEANLYDEWVAGREPNEQNLINASLKMMGLPYLWGGTSFKGVDCSGFTKTVYFMNGLILPRDASQQVHVGIEIDTSGNWKNLKPGDLLFFGVPAKDGKPERVVHVGMWIGGNNEFIHSSSNVRISSMNQDAPNFDEYELNRFLRVKRISPEDVIDLRKSAVFTAATGQ